MLLINVNTSTAIISWCMTFVLGFIIGFVIILANQIHNMKLKKDHEFKADIELTEPNSFISEIHYNKEKDSSRALESFNKDAH